MSGGSGGGAGGTSIRTWVAMAAIVGLGGLFALAALGAVLNATSSAKVHSGASREANIAFAVVNCLLLAGCGWAAAHLEHKIRRRQPIARSYVSPARPGTLVARHRRYAPVVLGILSVLYLTWFAVMLTATLQFRGGAARSRRVQRHGIVVDATVVSVHNVQRHEYFSIRFPDPRHTAEVSVTLVTAVENRTTATVHDPDYFSDLRSGDVVRVLVDPAHPDYAELPGLPRFTDSQWKAWLVVTVSIGLLGAVVAFEWIHVLGHRYRERRRDGVPTAGEPIT